MLIILLTTVAVSAQSLTGSIAVAGNGWTNKTAIQLNLTASSASGPIEMRFSPDSLSWTAYEPFSTTKNYTLTSGEGVKRIYVIFKDASGDTLKQSATVLLDQTPPFITSVYAPSPKNYKTGDTLRFTLYHNEFITDPHYSDSLPYLNVILNSGKVKATFTSAINSPSSYRWYWSEHHDDGSSTGDVYCADKWCKDKRRWYF